MLLFFNINVNFFTDEAIIITIIIIVVVVIIKHLKSLQSINVNERTHLSSQITAFKSRWLVGSSNIRRVGSINRALEEYNENDLKVKMIINII